MVYTVSDFIFLGSKINVDGDCSHKVKKCLLLGKQAMTNLDCIKKQRHHFTNKGLFCQCYDFPNSHVWLWELDHKEGWVPKNWCFWTVVLEKTLESPLDCKDIKPVHPKGNQPWIFIGRTGAKAEPPILWPPDAKNWLMGKDPDAGRDWGEEEKGKRRGWDGWMASRTQWTWVWVTPWVRDGQGGLSCCSSWGRRVVHNWVTEQDVMLEWPCFCLNPLWSVTSSMSCEITITHCRGESSQGELWVSVWVYPIQQESSAVA